MGCLEDAVKFDDSLADTASVQDGGLVEHVRADISVACPPTFPHQFGGIQSVRLPAAAPPHRCIFPPGTRTQRRYFKANEKQTRCAEIQRFCYTNKIILLK